MKCDKNYFVNHSVEFRLFNHLSSGLLRLTGFALICSRKIRGGEGPSEK